jgi:hypothetical protein
MYNLVLFTIGMNKGIIMQKTAQEMGRWNKFREKTNISGLATENWFDPEFKEIMDNLRNKTDDPIRTIISGKSIGKYPTDGVSCKELLKSARSYFNRREYMKTVADLGRFHKKLQDVVEILKKFNVNIDKVHGRFLFDEVTPGGKGYNPEYAKYLHDIKTRFSEPKKADMQHTFVKEAGIIDFFKNIGSKRGLALAAWEKRYPGKVKELKKSTTYLLDQSDNLLKQTLYYLKSMATARANRQVDEYKQAGDKITEYYNIYDGIFKKYYNDHLKTLMDAQEFVEKVVPVENATELGSTDIGKPDGKPTGTPSKDKPAYTSSTIDVMTPSPELSSVTPGVVVPSGGSQEMALFQTPFPSGFVGAPRGLVRPTTQQPTTTAPVVQTTTAPVVPEDAPFNAAMTPIQRAQLEENKRAKEEAEKKAKESANAQNRPTHPPGRKGGHSKFIESLESLSGEHPIILAKVILKYANSIEKSDPLFYNQLINIAKSIKV